MGEKCARIGVHCENRNGKLGCLFRKNDIEFTQNINSFWHNPITNDWIICIVLTQDTQFYFHFILSGALNSLEAVSKNGSTPPEVVFITYINLFL